MPSKRENRQPPRDVDREIARLRQIASESGDHLLLADGPVNADAALLELCSEALYLLTHAEQLSARTKALHNGEEWDDARRAESHRLWEARDHEVTKAKPLLSRIRKLRATTGPGIYAKALVLRASITGAPHLAKSLAEDLIACSELRATLWPAAPEEVLS